MSEPQDISTKYIHHVIEQAMSLGLVLVIEYNGGQRTVEPHALGVSRAGQPCFRAWQVSGDSLSGEKSGWKMFLLSELYGIKMIDRKSEAPRPGYKQGDKGMSVIHHELEMPSAT